MEAHPMSSLMKPSRCQLFSRIISAEVISGTAGISLVTGSIFCEIYLLERRSAKRNAPEKLQSGITTKHTTKAIKWQFVERQAPDGEWPYKIAKNLRKKLSRKIDKSGMQSIFRHTFVKPATFLSAKRVSSSVGGPKTALPPLASSLLQQWHNVLFVTKSASDLHKLLDENVVFRTPIYHKERKGAQTVGLILISAMENFGSGANICQYIFF